MPPTPVIISQSREAEVDRSILKIILLAVFGIGLNILAAYMFLQFLSDLKASNFLGWLFVFLCFLILVVLETFFIKSFAKLQVIMFLHGIAPLSLLFSQLYPKPSVLILIGGALFAFFLMEGAGRGWKLLTNSLVIKFSQIARNILPKAIVGALVFASILTYVYYFEMGKFTDRLGQSIVYETLSSAEPILKIWFPGASFNQNAQEFLEKIAETELHKMPENVIGGAATSIQIDFNALPPQVRAKIIREAAAQIRISLEKVAGPLPDGEMVKDIIFSIIKKYVVDFSIKTSWLFGILVVVAVFFTLKGILSLLKWLIILIAFVLFKFLIITGFAYTNLETRSREFVLLS